MRSMKAILLGLSLLLVLFAGCAGNGSTTAKVDANKPPSSVGVDDPGKGKIVGGVTNDEAIPLPGASVLLFAAGQSTPQIVTTDAAGAFAFLGLEPGVYLLVAQKFGFDDRKETNVQVEAGQTVEKTLALTPMPSNEPFSEVRSKVGLITGYGAKTPTGFYNYALTLGTSFTKNSDDWKPGGKPEGMENVVGEVQWTNQQVLGGNLYFCVAVVRHCDSADADLVRKEGPSLISVLAKKEVVSAVVAKNLDECKGADKTCHLEWFVYAGAGNTNVEQADFAFAFQQPFAVKVTTFFRMPAPAGYSAFK